MHTHVHAPSMPTDRLHTPPQTCSLPPTPLCTQGPSATLHILRLPSKFPSTSCHLHTDAHMLKSTGSRTHVCTHTFSQSHNLGGWGPQAATCMHATATEGMQPLCLLIHHVYLFAHTSTSAHVLPFALKSSQGSHAQTLKIRLSPATLCQSRAFICQQVCLPTQL